jgi:cytochrome c oxidase subunit 1
VSPSDFQQQDTYYIVAHIHYVLFGGSLLGLLAGIYYWFPKITGRMYSEYWGKITFWLLFIGMNLTFFPMHFLGLNGMPRRIYTYASEFGWGDLNLLATVGYFVIFLGFVAFVVNIIKGLRNGRRAGHDPWDAPTLEWSISSPPPTYNFAQIPSVEGRDHYWIVKQRAKDNGQPRLPAEAHVDPNSVHMPSPSYWPIWIAAGVALIGGGILSHFALSFVGGAITFLGIVGWANEPTVAPNAHDTASDAQH